jgi:hypothetical protein
MAQEPIHMRMNSVRPMGQISNPSKPSRQP